MWSNEAAEISIRPLTKGDKLDDLIALSRQFFTVYEAHHPDFFEIDNLDDGDATAYFSHWLENDDGETFVALVEGKIIGYITVYVREQADYWKVKQVGVISGLMVHPTHRRRGIAGQLFGQAKVFFKEKGVRYFTAYTAVANQGAIEFYEQSGLTPLHTTMIGLAGNTLLRSG